MHVFLQRDFDSFRRETGSDTKALKEANEGLSREKNDLSVQVARLNSSIEYMNGNFIALTETYLIGYIFFF